jgi:hypothetical protein
MPNSSTRQMNKNGSSLALLYQIFYINTHELRFIVELYLRSHMLNTCIKMYKLFNTIITLSL